MLRRVGKDERAEGALVDAPLRVQAGIKVSAYVYCRFAREALQSTGEVCIMLGFFLCGGVGLRAICVQDDYFRGAVEMYGHCASTVRNDRFQVGEDLFVDHDGCTSLLYAGFHLLF